MPWCACSYPERDAVMQSLSSGTCALMNPPTAPCQRTCVADEGQDSE